jgi:hypothetical protein
VANNKFKVRNGLFSNNITLSDDVENSVSEMTISMSGSDLIILDETAGVERLFIDSSGKAQETVVLLLRLEHLVKAVLLLQTVRQVLIPLEVG